MSARRTAVTGLGLGAALFGALFALAPTDSHAQRAGVRAPRPRATPDAGASRIAPPERRTEFDFEDDEVTLPPRTDAGLAAPDAIEAQVARRQAEVRQCFAGALGGDAGARAAGPDGAQPSVSVRFRVLADGSVTDVSLVGNSAGSAGDCVLGAARAWRFSLAPGSGPTRVSYTWRFES